MPKLIFLFLEFHKKELFSYSSADKERFYNWFIRYENKILFEETFQDLQIVLMSLGFRERKDVNKHKKKENSLEIKPEEPLAENVVALQKLPKDAEVGPEHSKTFQCDVPATLLLQEIKSEEPLDENAVALQKLQKDAEVWTKQAKTFQCDVPATLLLQEINPTKLISIKKEDKIKGAVMKAILMDINKLKLFIAENPNMAFLSNVSYSHISGLIHVAYTIYKNGEYFHVYYMELPIQP